MNLIFLVIIIHRWILQLFRQRLQGNDLRPRLLAMQRALEQRDYGLGSLAQPRHEGEKWLDLCIETQLRRGQLRLESLAGLARLWEQAWRVQSSCEKLLLLSLLHGGLGLVLALTVHLLLAHELWLTLPHRPMLCGAMIFYALALYVLLARIPWPPLLTKSSRRKEFIRAWFAQAEAGPWQIELEELKQIEWREGRSQVEARHRSLERWWAEEAARIEREVSVHEEWLGLWELLVALGLGIGLWGPYLLGMLSSLANLGSL